jgi:hypothetical protein
MRWDVPEIHIRACIWLATFGDLGVLRCFRGFGKSTMLAIYNAWRYHEDPTLRLLHQGDQDKTAYKTSRDTKRVLMRHPMTAGLKDIRGESAFWWVPGADDERNPSMQAAGITSGITSSRADEIQNDDVEVPKNITNPEAREKMRYRLGEQTHILVPGGRMLYIGTPHTHDSLYDEMERIGANCLTIKMFEHEFRIESATKREYELPFRPVYVFFGIGASSRLLTPGEDYTFHKGMLKFIKAPMGLVDCYSESAWPARFDRAELQKRRTRTRTINEWDSQYQLHSKPISEIRLDPAQITAYDVEPVVRVANRQASMWLGKVQIAGMAARWDPASAKLGSDVSAFGLVLQDTRGRRYIHRAEALTGEVAEFSQEQRQYSRIVGGQVFQICELVQKYRIPRIVVETNGIGVFAPAVLRQALKQFGLVCGVVEEPAVVNKNRRILEAFEDVLSSRMLWGHVNVLRGPLWDQMKDFNPLTQNQADDYIDVTASAIVDQPERIKTLPADLGPDGGDWRPAGGVHEVQFEFSRESARH